MATPNTNSTRRGALAVIGWRIVGIGATLATNIVAARLLGPAEFGIYLLVTTIISLGALVGVAGQNEAGLRFISESLALNRGDLARAYLLKSLSIVALSSLAAALVVATGMGAFQATALHFASPPFLIACAALGVFMLAATQIAAESLRGYGDLKLASMFSGGQTGGPISNLFLFGALLAAAFLAGSLTASMAIALTVFSIALAAPIALGALYLVSRPSGDKVSQLSAADHGTLSRQHQRTLLAVGGVLLVNQLLAFVGQQVDIWIGGAMLSPEELGLYGAVKRSLLMAAMPVQMAMMTVMATIPRLRAQNRTADLERVVRGAATYAAIPAILALAALAIMPETILQFIFGGSYSGAAAIVVVMVLGHLVLVLTGNPPYVLTMTGRHKTVLYVNLAAAAILLIAGPLAARSFGAVGLAAVSSLSFAFQNSVLWWCAHKQLGVWTHLGMPMRSPLSPAKATVDSPADTVLS